MPIVNLVFGLLWLLKGDIPVGKNKRVKPLVAKTIGAMVLLMTVVSIAAIFIQPRSFFVNFGILAPILALIIGFTNTEKRPEVNSS